MWELASNREVYPRILNYLDGIPDAVEEGALAYTPATPGTPGTTGTPGEEKVQLSSETNPVFGSLVKLMQEGTCRSRVPTAVRPGTI
jgi:hypothetical protein